MEKANPVREKSYAFALQIVFVSRKLMNEHKEYVLSKQFLKSGTSVGANIEEAIQAQSKADFISKMSIALKEAYESRYWIRLLTDSGYLQGDLQPSLQKQITEIISLLVAILKTSKK